MQGMAAIAPRQDDVQHLKRRSTCAEANPKMQSRPMARLQGEAGTQDQELATEGMDPVMKPARLTV